MAKTQSSRSLRNTTSQLTPCSLKNAPT
jgi:hypothetical protein